MGKIDTLDKIALERDSTHRNVECTYSVVNGPDGEKYLQIDSYGSAERVFKGKKSQSMRFTPKAIEQLKTILSSEF